MDGQKGHKTNKCKICDKEYYVAETKRIFGDMSWIGDFCSAQCYTSFTQADTLEIVPTPTTYAHNEAFCLMIYTCDKCKAMEIIWNSRDGVTPFMTSCRFCDGTVAHDNWYLDKQLPEYKPFKGQRVFIDLTEENCRKYTTKRVDALWDHPEFPMKENYATKDKGIEALMELFDPNNGNPDIIIFEGVEDEVDKK